MDNLKNELRSEISAESIKTQINRPNTRRQFLFLSLFSLGSLNGTAKAERTNGNGISAEKKFSVSHEDSSETSNLAMVLPKTLIDVSQLREDPSNYLMSEKFDGVRAYWDGKQLYFRSGRLIHPPVWFTERFPTHPMDGELWIGRGQFERLSGIVRRLQANDEEWRQIQYCLFESPLAAGDFRQRMHNLQNTVAKVSIPWLRVIPHESVKSVEQITARLKQLTLQKAEGLVLHLASAEFQAGRSEFVYKLKPQHDAEAKVVGIQAGQGKYQGMMGALLLETPEGKRFKLGTGFDDSERRKPPAIGSLVTYRYRDLTSNGLPKFASFVRVYQAD